MKIGFVQYRPAFLQVKENTARVTEMLSSIEANLMVLPELAFCGYVFDRMSQVEEVAEEVPEGPTTEALTKIAAEKKMTIVAGLAEVESGRYYNSVVVVGHRGYVGSYRKAHLFNEEKNWFARGNSAYRVYRVGEARVGVMICYDWMFPEVSRVLGLIGADIIAHPANLVMPWGQTGMVTRSLENGVFSITANRIGTEGPGGDHSYTFTGKSQILDTRGQVIEQAGEDTEEVRVAEIDPTAARKKLFGPINDFYADRRVELYGKIIR